MNKWYELKPAALGLTFILMILGIIFIGLDILDIAEDYRLYWPIAVTNTIFIGAVSLLTIYFTTKNYLQSGSTEMLALGSGALAFGLSIILYGWLTNTDLDTRITAYNSGVLLASAVYLAGAILGKKIHPSGGKLGANKFTIFITYAIVIILIGIITWLAYEDIITSFRKTFTEHLTIRGLVQGIAAVLCVSSALIYLKRYRNLRADIYFWYSLGLILFTAGVLFISRGSLESRIAWLGRASQYVAGIYFFAAAMTTCKQLKNNRVADKRES